jgi:hypothetical protein
MITRDQLLASMRHETNVVKHLGTKVPAGKLDFRPTPQQRSTLELMQYLTATSLIGVKWVIHGTWDHVEALEKAAESVAPTDFAAAMDRQMADVEKEIRAVAEKDFLTKATKMPWGAPTVLGISLVDCGLKPLVAYRMQLFLYLKESGASELGTAQCWMGVDPPKK